ncbi:MAG: hypothetical protein GWO85_00170 [Simkaniaceae bacterium]|nr:hypothetical protein [Simkaniaceae bacterium]
MADVMSLPTSSKHSLSDDDMQFIQRIAKKIYNTGLVTPAIFFLEMNKPLALLGSHAAIFFGPIVNAFIQADGYYRAAEIFEEPNHVELLIRALESLEASQSSGETEKPDTKPTTKE